MSNESILASVDDENLLASQSADELEKLINQKLQESPPEEEEPLQVIESEPEVEQIEEVQEAEEVEEPQEEVAQEVEEDEEDDEGDEELRNAPIPDQNFQSVMTQNQQLINELIKRNNPLPESTDINPSKTNDELLDDLSKNPKAFIEDILNEKLQGQNADIQKLRKEQAWNAAMGNERFAKLAPKIKALQDEFPNISYGNDLKTLEGFMLMAEGMKAQENTAKAAKKEAKAAKKKAKAKKVASSIAPGSKPVPAKKAKKPQSMSSAELEKELIRLGAGI